MDGAGGYPGLSDFEAVSFGAASGWWFDCADWSGLARFGPD